MSLLISIEKGRSFPIPYNELFRMCEETLRSLGLEITLSENSQGVIQARKPSRWLVKSREQISVTVRPDSRVAVKGKVDMQKMVSGGYLITEEFFNVLQKLIADQT